MNLQGSSNVSLLSGSAGVENSQNISGVITGVPANAQAGTGEGVAEVFTTALLQQLELLKQTAATSSVQVATTPSNTVQITNSVVNPTFLAVTGGNIIPTLETKPNITEQILLNTPKGSGQALPDATEVAQVAAVLVTDNIVPSAQANITDSLQQLKEILAKLDVKDQMQTSTALQTTTLQNIMQEVQRVMQQITGTLQQVTQNVTLDAQQVGQTVQLARDVAQQISAMLNQAGVTADIVKQLPTGLQEISVVNGKQLPTAKKTTQEVDQQGTLQALADVMAQVTAVVTQLQTVAQPIQAKSPTPAIEEKTVDPNTKNPDAITLVAATQVQATLPQASASTGTQEENSSILRTTAEHALFDNRGVASKLSVGNTDNAQTPAQQTQQVPQTPILMGVSTKEMGVKIGNGELSTQQELNNLGELTTIQANVIPDAQSKDQSNRVAADMLQLGQQLATDNKVTTVPAMSKHVYSAEWNQELGSKIVWMTSQNITAADIKLNPEHLGPISIRIDMHQDQANISFTAMNSGVKELLEASIPKLREMLGAQQLNLADVNVSQNSFSGQGQAQAQHFGQGGEGKQAQRSQEGLTEYAGQPDAVDEVTNHIEQSRAIVTNGIVSYYA